MRLGLITYDTPHLKTEQIALRLAARGMPFDVLAIPFTARTARNPAFQHRPDMTDAAHPSDVARRLGRAFRRFASEDLPEDYDLFLIAGAGILPGSVVSRVRTLNGHPGLIPAVRGLDAFKWSIHDGMELGVTVHYVDAEVDKGTPLAQLRTPVFADDTIERLARRHYETEIDLLVDFERWLLRPMPPDVTIEERPSRMRMPLDIEREMLGRFPAFRKKFAGVTRKDMGMIPFIDLGAQRRRLGTAVDDAMARVLDHGGFIMGPEVKALEAELARFCGAKHVVTCANGTDALGLVLMAKGVGEGDAVLCPTFTFAATAEVVAWLGATPVLVDVKADTFNTDPASLAAAIKVAKAKGLKPTAFIPVDLFGQPADYDALEPICAREGLWMLSDAAQSFGATYKGRKVGSIGLATTTSFFPAKPLGCYGDGGAIFTDDDELAAVLRSLRVHGQGTDKYDNVRIGLNARLDTLQAAVLLEKLKIFTDEIATRDTVAARYAELLGEVAIVPRVPQGLTSVWAQYTLRLPGIDRDAFQAALKAAGVPTAIYYPRPLHQQTAYRDFPIAGNGLPVSERLALEVVSLPMHPYLDAATQDRVVAAVKDALSAQRGRAAAE